jgi:hypothetical protein
MVDISPHSSSSYKVVSFPYHKSKETYAACLKNKSAIFLSYILLVDIYHVAINRSADNRERFPRSFFYTHDKSFRNILQHSSNITCYSLSSGNRYCLSYLNNSHCVSHTVRWSTSQNKLKSKVSRVLTKLFDFPDYLYFVKKTERQMQ